MICERCAQPVRITFFVPDQEAWNTLSPYGDARGIYCLTCADGLAAAAGLANVPVLIGFYGKALQAPNERAYAGMVEASYISARVVRLHDTAEPCEHPRPYEAGGGDADEHANA